ncbi:restriction endonuclease subunit S [Moheibacter sediminis]|nr:restriction endonuclease subunit S [Moheibacter sediminis]
MSNNISNITFVKFSKLYNWSVQYLIEDTFSFKQDFPFVPIGKFLKRNKTNVEILNGIQYKRVTIKTNNGGVYLRDIQIGDKIGTKNQFLIKEGQFLLSKIDARNGAFGVVTSDVDGAIITGNFWTFDVDYTQINPHYLTLITTTPEFIKFCENSSTGTTNRHYLQENLFLAVEIPLPPLDDEDAKEKKVSNEITQKKLVDAYYQKIIDAENAKIKAKETEKEIEKYLLKELGVENILNSHGINGLTFINFKNLDRWDVLSLQSQSLNIKSIYNTVKLSSLITCFNYDIDRKSLRFETYKYPNEEFYYLGMENVERDTGKLIDLPIVKGSQIKSQTLKVPKDFIIYGKLRPYLNKYWHNTSDFSDIVCSSEFFVFNIDESKIDKSYFLDVLSSSIVQRQISDKYSGVRMPRISSSDFYNLEIPLPSDKNLQQIISNNIRKLRLQASDYNDVSNNLVKEALVDFEKTIFKN